MTLIPFIVIWVVLAATVLALLAYRQVVTRGEDDSLHLVHEGQVSTHQSAVAHKVQTIDKWGKLLTVVAVIYALLLAAAFVYQTFMNQSTTVGM
jgi:hypothetical protein